MSRRMDRSIDKMSVRQRGKLRKQVEFLISQYVSTPRCVPSVPMDVLLVTLKGLSGS